MSGFHPILGLLAVAVCISYAEGAPFLAVQKEDITVNKLHETDLHQSEQSAKNNGQDIISIDGDALLARADRGGSGSGDINDESGGSDAILGSGEKSAHSEESFSQSEESAGKQSTEDDVSNLGSRVQTSKSEEDCDDEENKDSTSRTPSSVPEQSTVEETIAPSQTQEPTQDVTTNPEDGCEGEDDGNKEKSTPGTPTSSTESSGSDSQEEGSDENEDCEEPTSPKTPETTRPSRPTTTRRPTKKPNKDNSSGSFNDSDPDGVDFSDSNSDESRGKSTELSDQLID